MKYKIEFNLYRPQYIYIYIYISLDKSVCFLEIGTFDDFQGISQPR
jgi:hypothetical protein